MTSKIKNILQASIETKRKVLENEHTVQLIAAVSEVMTNAFQAGKKVYFCGNGGSAADAQHLAAELSGAFYNRNRRPLPAEALHCNTSYLTAVANDFDFSMVYVRLVEAITDAGDVLIGLSTSGNSANVVKAFEAARSKGVITVGFTGESGGTMRELSDYLFNIPSTDTPRIQEAHMLIGHILCELVEGAIFPV